MDTQKKNLITNADEVSIVLSLPKSELTSLLSTLERIKKSMAEIDVTNKSIVSDICDAVCGYLDVPVAALYQKEKSKKKSYCVSLICYILNRQYGFHPTYLAAHFGLHRTTVLYLIKRYDKILNNDGHAEVFSAIWQQIKNT